KHFYIIEISDNEGNKGYGESVAFISPWYTEETVETNIHMMRDFLIPILKENTIKDRKSTRLNSSHVSISYAVFCLKKKNINPISFCAKLFNVKNKLIHNRLDVIVEYLNNFHEWHE